MKRTPQSILDAQLKAWDKVVDQYSKDAFFKKVVDNQKSWAQDEAYCNIMMNNDFALAYNHYYGKEHPLGSKPVWHSRACVREIAGTAHRRRPRLLFV